MSDFLNNSDLIEENDRLVSRMQSLEAEVALLKKRLDRANGTIQAQDIELAEWEKGERVAVSKADVAAIVTQLHCDLNGPEWATYGGTGYA